MAFLCPACNKPLYNRRRPTCGACGASLPEHLRLSAAQQQRLEAMRQQEAKDHKEFMERELPGGNGSASLTFD
jgi:predicted amidophosphoribosyltransferase